MRDLEGKVAVITGAGSGVGRALAHRCARERMRLVVADIDPGAMYEVADALDAAGTSVQTLETDVSKQTQVSALADLAYERFGAVDLLCNNAGVGVVGALWERTLADWSWALGVNLWGVIHGVRAFVPRMLEQKSEAHIVNTASIAGLLCPPLSGPYVASKQAVVGLSECLFHDLNLRGADIGVSVVCPGFVRTNISHSERVRPEDLKDPLAADDALAEEVASYYDNAVDSGIAPEAVADAILDAVRQRRFWVLTHPEMTRALRSRFDGIVAGENPVTRALDQIVRASKPSE